MPSKRSSAASGNRARDVASAWKRRVTNAKAAHVVVTTSDFAGIRAGSRLLIASPDIIVRYLMQIPAGETRTLQRMRNELARRHRADATCPVTTAIYLRAVAESAWDDLNAGAAREHVPPFWRVIEPGSPIAKRLRCGNAVLEQERSAEGIVTPPAGAPPRPRKGARRAGRAG
jgi:hypothetical protein